jgi:hypothetical protein
MEVKKRGSGFFGIVNPAKSPILAVNDLVNDVEGSEYIFFYSEMFFPHYKGINP